jgi:N6-adenosine-specific RNA methylase IME4
MTQSSPNLVVLADRYLDKAKDDNDFAQIARLIKEYGIADLDADRTVEDLIKARDKVSAVETLIARCVKDQDLQLQAGNDIAELRLRQERRIGQMLKAMEKQAGARTPQRSDTVSPQTLAELGIHKKQSSRWQAEAKVPEPVFEKYIATTKRSGGELTSKAVVKLAMQSPAPVSSVVYPTQFENCRVVSDLVTLIAEGEIYSTIYADPPWRYGNQATRAATDNHYSTMTVDEICGLPVAKLAGENAHLHLWTTNAFLFDAKRVMEAWGFTYKSCFVWCKPQMGIGNYWRVSHEFLLLGVKGKLSFNDKGLMSWESISRGEHSTKPESIRMKIEKTSPAPFLELFGRRTSPGWTVFGNQVERTLFDRRES